MRHVDRKKPYSYYSYSATGRIASHPYEHQYTDSWNKNRFAKALPSRRYVQVIQFVADHDGCKRIDILKGLGLAKKSKIEKANISYDNRGEDSALFSQLLYIDVIDYDEKFCYHITDNGREVLKTASINAKLNK